MPSDAKDTLAFMPWYPRDWRASTARAMLIGCPTACHCYRELLDAMWGSGSLPDDDHGLAALCGVTLKSWKRVRQRVLRHLPKNTDGTLGQPRLTYERDKALGLRDAKRAGAEATNAIRAAKKAESERLASAADHAQRTPPPAPAEAPAQSPSPAGEKQISEPTVPHPTKRREPSPLPPLAVLWNEKTWGILAKCSTWNGVRARDGRNRLAEQPDLEVWGKAFSLLAASPHHRGENDRGWMATIDFILTAKQAPIWLDAAMNGNGKVARRGILTNDEILALGDSHES